MKKLDLIDIKTGSSPRFTYAFKTLGCKANVYDSLVLEENLRKQGGQAATTHDAVDYFFVNSCTVTAEADRQSIREVQRAKRDHTNTKTIFTGCMAEVSQQVLNKEASIDYVFKNSEKDKISHLVESLIRGTTPDYSKLPETFDESVFWGELPINAGKTRAFLKIQEGCNDYCTYCIIPYARGKSRSVALDRIIFVVPTLR